jgi:type I restriction enzyme, S subunit
VTQSLPLKRFVDPARPITYGIVQAGPDSPGGVPYIRPVDMDGHNGIPDPAVLRTTSPEIAAVYRRSMVRRGDIVVSIGPSFGKTLLVDDVRLDGANLTQGTARVAPKVGVDAGFLRWALQSGEALAHWEASVGGATFRALNLGPLAATPVPRVPLVLQRAIADFLDTETARIDALIEKKQLLARRLAERRTALIDQLFEQQPESPRLSRVLKQSPCYGVLKPDRYDGQGAVPCIRISEIGADGDLDLAEAITISPTQHAEYNRTRLRRGDVLVSCVGTIGRAAVVSEEAVGANVSRAVARLVPRTGLDPRYLSLWTESTGFRCAVDLIVNATAQPVLNMGDLASMKFPMPVNTEETRRLWADTRTRLAPIKGARAALSQQLALLTERRQALVTAAVSGELEVPGVAA